MNNPRQKYAALADKPPLPKPKPISNDNETLKTALDNQSSFTTAYFKDLLLKERYQKEEEKVDDMMVRYTPSNMASVSNSVSIDADPFAVYQEIKQRRLEEYMLDIKGHKSRWAAYRLAQKNESANTNGPYFLMLETQESMETLNIQENEELEVVSICNDDSESTSNSIYRLSRPSSAWRLSTLAMSPLPMPEIKPCQGIAVWPPHVKLVLPHPELIVNGQPPTFEPYYTTLKSKSTRLILPGEPNVVYDDQSQKSINKKKNLSTSSLYRSTTDDTLLFESRFESGNLRKAIRLKKHEYELHIRKDINTKGHTQWFYFRIQNVRKDETYRFHFTNLVKPTSLYESGMQPLLYSTHLAQIDGIGWHRCGFHISYTANPVENEDSKQTYTLSLSIQFPVNYDTVYLAHCYPYTYTDLQSYLLTVKEDPILSDRFRHRVLCKSLGGNKYDGLSIVNQPDELTGRPAMILTARVHPGETNASYMMQGFLDFILGDSDEAQDLRSRFVIKVVPMMNPDGVIIGNHRCNLAGYDLNRRWNMKDSGVKNSPEVFHVRNMIAQTSEDRPLLFHIDFHGHNRKHGIFAYGCNNNLNPSRQWVERVFPFMLQEQDPDMFHFRRCQFRIQKKKEGTSRITLWRKFDLLHSFTIEASFCGSDAACTDKPFQYHTSHLERMGASIGKTLFNYFKEFILDFDLGQSLSASTLGSYAQRIHHQLSTKFKTDDSLVLPEQSDSSDTTSDDEELRIVVKKTKKFIKKIKVVKNVEDVSDTASQISNMTSRTNLSSVKSKVGSIRKTPSVRPRSATPQMTRVDRDDQASPVSRIPYNAPAVQISSVSLNDPRNHTSHSKHLYLGHMHSGLRSECPIHAPKTRLEKEELAKSRASYSLRRKEMVYH